jgi:hypothetical protein
MLLVAGDIANCSFVRLIRIQAGNPTDMYPRNDNEVFSPGPGHKRKLIGIPLKHKDLFIFIQKKFSL